MITVGPDGALWFSESDVEKSDNVNKIGRITTAGTFTEFTPPTAGIKPQGITVGSDGAIWLPKLPAIKSDASRLTAISTNSQRRIQLPSSARRHHNRHDLAPRRRHL